MKTSMITCLAVALLSFSSPVKSNNRHVEKDSTHCLQVEGKITNSFEDLEAPCRIELFCANQVVDSISLNGNKRMFKFVLQKNKYYTVKISRPGYTTKLICVDTKLTETTDWLFRFMFSTELYSEQEAGKLNQDALDFPVAIISFDKKEGRFDYNKEYTAGVKRQLYCSEGPNYITKQYLLPRLAINKKP